MVAPLSTEGDGRLAEMLLIPLINLARVEINLGCDSSHRGKKSPCISLCSAVSKKVGQWDVQSTFIEFYLYEKEFSHFQECSAGHSWGASS